LTTPDLVVLSLLVEKAAHGYQLNQELSHRGIRDWAEISRPQIYYSLNKLFQLQYIRFAEGLSQERKSTTSAERQVYEATNEGRHALTQALEREDWATQRTSPAFSTWLSLSTHANPGAARRLIYLRRQFLQDQVSREKTMLEKLRSDAASKM